MNDTEAKISLRRCAQDRDLGDRGIRAVLDFAVLIGFALVMIAIETWSFKRMKLQ